MIAWGRFAGLAWRGTPNPWRRGSDRAQTTGVGTNGGW